MANSIINGTGNGSTTTFAINFTLGFLSRDDVTFYVDGEVDGLGAQIYRTITWINDGMISIAAPVALGDTYHIARTVDKTQLAHDYADGEPIEEVNLDESFKQTLMAVHEFLDGRLTSTLQNNLDAGNHKIINLADGTDPTDSVNFGQLSDVQDQVDSLLADATAQANAAHADKLLADADVVLTHADVVLTHADVVTTGTNASTSTTQAGIATTQASTATTQAGLAATAKTAADADVVLTHADVVLTHADVVLTHADVVLTHADVTTTAGNVTTTAASATAAAASATAASNSATSASTNAALAAASAGFKYTYSSTTSAADPTSGKVRFNNAALASATEMYISETDGNSLAIAGVLATWDDSTNTIKGTLRVFSQAAATNFAIFNITGSITDNGAWDTFTVAYVTGGGTISNNDALTLQFVRNGDTGATGSAGSNGSNGSAGSNGADGAAGFRNKIINGNMRRWDYSTSYALTTSIAYGGPNRWASFMVTSAAGVLAQSTSVPTGFKFSMKLGRNNGSALTNTLAVYQNIESLNSIPLQGQTVTLSYYAKAGANYSASGSTIGVNLYSGTGTDQATTLVGSWTGQATQINASDAINTTWQRFQHTVTLPSTITQLILQFVYTPTGTAGADDNVYITGVQLEVASAATAFEDRGEGIEAFLCARYAPILGGVTGPLGTGWATSTSASGYHIEIPVPTRIAATGLTVTTVGDIEIATFAGADVAALTGLTFSKASTNSVFVTATVSGTPLTAATSYLLYTKTALTGNIILTGIEL